MKKPIETIGRRDDDFSATHSHQQIKPVDVRNRSSRRRRCARQTKTISPLPIDLKKEIQDVAVEYVAGALHKVSPVELCNILSDRYFLGARQVRPIIRSLLTAGELSYTYEYGTSYLEISVQRPLNISERIVILPPGLERDPRKAPAAVRISTGASFGSGRHPTTRLALRAIDAAMSPSTAQFNDSDTALLDIGTGSGILAIAALQLGIARAVGIDPDPCARVEAAENAALNGLASRFSITDQPLSRFPHSEKFTIITANLRYPTLVRLCGTVVSHLATCGSLVLSGIKNTEQAFIMDVYGEKGFACRWQAMEKDWVGLVLQQSSF
jgi:ribosomal protein L11 methyltransferase